MCYRKTIILFCTLEAENDSLFSDKLLIIAAMKTKPVTRGLAGFKLSSVSCVNSIKLPSSTVSLANSKGRDDIEDLQQELQNSSFKHADRNWVVNPTVATYAKSTVGL